MATSQSSKPMFTKKSAFDGVNPFGIVVLVIVGAIVLGLFASRMIYEADGLDHPMMESDQSSKRDANINP